MLGTHTVIITKIALLFKPVLAGLNQDPAHSLVIASGVFFSWIFNMTCLSGNNTQEALLKRSNCESDQQVPEVRDERVDLGF